MIDQHNSLAEKFLKKGFWLYLFSFILAPIGYIIKIIISGELSVSEVGILYGVISLIALVSAFNDFGMTESLNKFIPQYIINKDYVKIKSILTYALLTQLTTGFLLAGFFFFGSDFISNSFFKTDTASHILKIFSLYFIGINIFQVITTFFLAIQNTFLNKLLELLRMLFTLINVLWFYSIDFSSLIYFSFTWITGLYLGFIIALIMFYQKYYKKYFKNISIIWNWKLYSEIFKYSIWVFLGAQAATILGQIDMQMIIYLLGTTDAGYYTNYLSIIGIPFMIIGPIFSLLFPIFSEMHSKGEIEKIKLVKSIFQKNFLAIGIAFNILFFVFAEIIAYTLFGEKFIESGTILKYSILFLTFNFLLQINFNIMAGIGQVKDRFKIIAIALIFNFIMNLFFIKLIGVYGASLATGLGWILIWILSELFLGKQYFVKLDYKFLLKNIILMGLIGYLTNNYLLNIFDSLSRVQSLLYLFIFSLIYFILFVCLNSNNFKKLIIQIKNIKQKNKKNA